MGTVGLSFGSATSGAGFDVKATVTSILAIEGGVETPWKAQIKASQAQDTVLSSLGTGLATLSTALSALTAFDGVLAAKEGASSDTNVLNLSSANASAVAGSHTVVVTSLAATASKYTDRLASTSDTLSGSITIAIGSGAPQTLTLSSTNNTLATLASAINNGGFGVSASVVTDTIGSRLSLVSKNSGAAGEITLSGALHDNTANVDVAFSTGQTGVDAKLTVDGLATTSASNTVTGAIPGVTFQLLQAAPSSTLQVQISNNNASVVSALQSLVTAYNSVAATVKTQEGKDANGVAQPLFGNPTLALLQGQLAGALSGGASGSIRGLDQIGLTVNTDGTLALNATTLQSALNTNYDDVTGFLQGSGGFGQKLTATLNGLSVSDPRGVLSLALAENSSKETQLNANIAKVEARLAIDNTRLTKELTTANQILQSIPSQLSQYDQIYSALSGYNPPAH